MLMVGAPWRLFYSLLVSLLPVPLLIWVGLADVSRLSVLMIAACSVHSFALACGLMGSDRVLVSAGENGLVFHRAISRNHVLDWADVKGISVVSPPAAPFLFPWFSYLFIRTSRRGFFTGVSRILPTAWFGLSIIPIRLVSGGGKSADQWLRMIAYMRENERHDGAHQWPAGFFTDRGPEWALLRNMEFPFDSKKGLDDEVLVKAMTQATLAEMGQHRDLLPPEIEAQLRANPVIQELETRVESMLRLEHEKACAQEMLLKRHSDDLGGVRAGSLSAAEREKASAPRIERSPVPMLNGKPLTAMDRRA